MSEKVDLSVLQILERNKGKNVRVVLDRNFGFEGEIATVSSDPPGLWISNADAIVMRTTLANPLPQVVSRENRSEIFVNLSSVQRIEILH
jgi:predicted RNA methylase